MMKYVPLLLLAAALPAAALAADVRMLKDTKILLPVSTGNGEEMKCLPGYELETVEARTMRAGKPVPSLYAFCRDPTDSRMAWIGKMQKVRDSMLENQQIGEWERDEIRTAFANYIESKRIR